MAYPRAPLRRFARRRSSFFSSSEEAPVRMVLTVLRALLMTNPYFYASRSRVAAMAKKRISSGDLVWIFQERVWSSDECSPGTYIAIVPSKSGWTAVMGAQRRKDYPDCARRIAEIQKELRKKYMLAK